MSFKEGFSNELFSREDAIKYFTIKYELKRRAVFEQINNLRAKLNPDKEDTDTTVYTSPNKRQRQLKELSRLERCYSHIHSVERRVQAALMRNRMY